MHGTMHLTRTYVHDNTYFVSLLFDSHSERNGGTELKHFILHIFMFGEELLSGLGLLKPPPPSFF